MDLLPDRQPPAQPRSECPARLGRTNEERNKTRCEDRPLRPLQGRTKVAPQRNVRARVAIRRPEKGRQKNPETARDAGQHTQYATMNAQTRACGKITCSSTAFIQGYAPSARKLRTHYSNPPCTVKSVPKTCVLAEENEENTHDDP
jgi:hypothetical protein